MTLGSVAAERVDFYGGQHPADVPLYGFADASRLLGVSPSTVRWWTQGRLQDGYEPVLSGARQRDYKGLSFSDLLEVHAIQRLRRVHGVELEAIRRAVRYAAEQMRITRPLLRDDLATFGGDIFVRELGDLVGLSAGGQVALRGVIESYLQRLDRDEALRPIRFYPSFMGMERVPGSKPISISPVIAFGRPTITGTSIKSAVVASRVDAGESEVEVAADYGLNVDQVTSAVMYEFAS